MIKNIQELRELIKIVLKSYDMDEEDEIFMVEGLTVNLDVMLEEDTLLPVIMLYSNHMINVLFNENKNVYNNKIFKTQNSLFYVKVDIKNEEKNENITPNHIKLLIIDNFFKSIIKKNKKIELSYLIENWRKILDNKKENEKITINQDEETMGLDMDEISALFEPVYDYNLN